MSEKVCKKCERSLPMNFDHFFKKKDTKDGFTSRCKECQGYSFSITFSKKKAKLGYKICIKCERELEKTIQYYTQDKMCKDGYRNVCRECSGRHYMSDEYRGKTYFTDIENETFKKLYPHYTNEELIDKFYPDQTFKQLMDRSFRLGGLKKTIETAKRADEQQRRKMSGVNSPMYGRKVSNETRMKISKARKGIKLGRISNPNDKRLTPEFKQRISERVRKLGLWKGNKNPRHLNPLKGSANGRWQGGITAENAKIRNSQEYRDWRFSVFKRDSFTCQCCNTPHGDLEAHHILNFSNHETLRFDIENGITLCYKCHNPTSINSFHYIYGCHNNNYGQLQEYIRRYKDGEFTVSNGNKAV